MTQKILKIVLSKNTLSTLTDFCLFIERFHTYSKCFIIKSLLYKDLPVLFAKLLLELYLAKFVNII